MAPDERTDDPASDIRTAGPGSTAGPVGNDASDDASDDDADEDVEDEEEDEHEAPGGLSWGRVAVLGLALAFLGFAIGFIATRDRPPGPDSVDVGFVQDMLTHHDQALRVAVLTAAYGENPTVRSMALDVIAFQQYEIGVMTQMLDDWGYTRTDRSDEAMGWMGMPVPVEQMPGLLTDEQLNDVAGAEGAELDALFLDYMAEHHRGGLHMAQEGAARASDPDVAALAARIERNQAAEINEYRALAQTLGLDIDIPPAEVPPADLPEQD
jgi:uncharacterized protein (DUF305 family)